MCENAAPGFGENWQERRIEKTGQAAACLWEAQGIDGRDIMAVRAGS